MKPVLLLLTCIILLSGIGTFAADPQETPPPIPQEEQNTPITPTVEQTDQTTPKEGPKLQKAPEEPEEPAFNFPAIVFKGKKLKRQDIGTFDRIFIDGKEISSDEITIETTGSIDVKIIKDNKTYTHSLYSINGILTLLPPLVAIILALIFKDVLIALFVGIFTGALFINRFDFITAFFNVVDKYVLEALTDTDRASIIIFTLLLGGMVGIITKSGGVKGIVDSLSRKVKSTKGVQLYTWLMGILIFFDDYTNTLVVGNTMRPLTDRWKISREKLAYIVDSTAAPMACIALISTWIGFEISLINQQLKALSVDLDAYHLFLSSIPYRFYPILAMIFVFLIFTLRRDFGPMHKAEKRAREEGKLLKDNAVPLSDFESSGLNPAKFVKAKWFNGLIPIIVVIASTFIGLYISGKASLAAKGDILGQLSVFEVIFSSRVFKNLGTIITSANSFQVLLWASLLGVCTAILLARIHKILKLKELITAFVQGLKSMMMAIVILVLAWSLGVVLGELNTADFLVSLISGNLDYHFFPGIVFIFSCLIAFSTGTSWGTLAIMYPLVIPIIIVLTRQTPDFHQFLVMTIASVLAGAVFGDHCSPISDTTIMSSMASSCDHIDHVRTQIPYAVLMAVIAFLVCILPVSFGFPYLLSLLAAIGLSLLILRFLGKKAGESKAVNQ
ncbi:MAG: Na+/H+ antiporter NhaC family protein [Candidatus Aminicenantes bacterium]